MPLILILISMNCPSPKIYNATSSWDTQDKLALMTARSGCSRYYSEDHCLVRFYKLKKNTYQAVCRKGG